MPIAVKHPSPADASDAKDAHQACDGSDVRPAEDTDDNSAAAQRDAMVRQVHHHVRNAVFSPLTLLELCLRDPSRIPSALPQAVAQLRAIGRIAAIQMADPGLRLSLAAVLREAADAAAQLHARKIALSEIRTSVRLAGTVLAPAHQLPIALVLDELIANAARHAPNGTPVGVRLRHGSRTARVAVVNTTVGDVADGAFAPRSPDSGLALVRRMLPVRGARLEVVASAGRAVAMLELSSPVI